MKTSTLELPDHVDLAYARFITAYFLVKNQGILLEDAALIAKLSPSEFQANYEQEERKSA